MYASLFPEKFKKLVLLATPTDFVSEDPGLLGLWTLFSRSNEGFFDPHLLVETFGNIPKDLIEHLVSAETSTAKPLADQYAPWFCATLRRFVPEVAVESRLAVSRWVDDGIPFPAKPCGSGFVTSTSTTSWSRGRSGCGAGVWSSRTSGSPY